MRVALVANGGIVQPDCGFFGGGRDIFAENDPRAHRALAAAGAARHTKKAPPGCGWGFGFFDGGFGLRDEVLDRVAPFAGDFTRVDCADAISPSSLSYFHPFPRFRLPTFPRA